jgi:hypothetical protein
MKTSSCKSKGRELQKHTAKVIREIFDLPEDDVVSRPMGSSGEDLLMSDRARKELPLSFECKNTKKFPSLAALDQAKENARDHQRCAVWKPPGKGMEDAIIYFNLREFLELWKGKNA